MHQSRDISLFSWEWVQVSEEHSMKFMYITGIRFFQISLQLFELDEMDQSIIDKDEVCKCTNH